MSESFRGYRAIVSPEIEAFGGAERSILALSRWLHKHQIPNYLIVYSDRVNLAQYADFPVRILELKPGAGSRDRILAIRRHLDTLGPSPYPPLMSGYPVALHAALSGLRRFHVLMHDTAFFGRRTHAPLKAKLRTAIANKIVGFGLRSGGKTFVNSEFLRAECRRDFGIEAEIVRMGGFRSADSSRIRPVTNQLHMLSVSRIEHNKRLDWVIRALAALEHELPPLSSRVDWHIDFVGEGSLLQPLSELARALGIADRVCFHGFLPDADLQRLYDQAHLFFMPAVQGYGIPAIEALQRGIPVLLHRESGVSDILLDTPWATVLFGDESEMVPAVRRAIDGVIHQSHGSAPMPGLPTEDGWAEEIARLCNWID